MGSCPCRRHRQGEQDAIAPASPVEQIEVAEHAWHVDAGSLGTRRTRTGLPLPRFAAIRTPLGGDASVRSCRPRLVPAELPAVTQNPPAGPSLAGGTSY